MGLFNYFKKKETSVSGIEIVAEKETIYQPINGEIILLKAIGDGVFSEGIMGKGCGLRPTGERVVAPIDGTVTTVAETLHAIGIESDDGMELLIHVGLDTVSMNGKGFSVKVKKGDRVKAGDLLLTFSKKEIASAGFEDTTAILVVNADDYEEVSLLRTGTGMAGEKLMKLRK